MVVEPGSAENRVGQTLADEDMLPLILLTGEAGPELEAYEARISAAAGALARATVEGPTGPIEGPVQSAEMVALAEEILGVCAGLGWS